MSADTKVDISPVTTKSEHPSTSNQSFIFGYPSPDLSDFEDPFSLLPLSPPSTMSGYSDHGHPFMSNTSRPQDEEYQRYLQTCSAPSSMSQAAYSPDLNNNQYNFLSQMPMTLSPPAQYSPPPQYPSYVEQLPSQTQLYHSSPLLPEFEAPSQTQPFPNFSPPMSFTPQQFSPQFLQPSEMPQLVRRVSRSTSLASNTSSKYSVSDSVSRSTSPGAAEMFNWGYRNERGSWSCAYPGCTSKSTFHRGCDLRKHYRRHTKTLFCRHAGCPQSTEGGFSSKKDRARHEAKHNPQIVCEWEGCDRLFSRLDNMKDHVRRIHRNDSQSSQ